jgi:hypothetical protein
MAELTALVFDSAIVNYNGSHDEAGHVGRGMDNVALCGGDDRECAAEEIEFVEDDDDDDGSPRGPKRPRRYKAFDLDCEYDLLAMDGDGAWRKETPTGRRGRPITIHFRDPLDKALVAADINAALASQVEPVRYAPVHTRPETSAPCFNSTS